ncbi:uncharacterized protein SPSK_02011 [Sporothrix schenckii 1099-18]|uniref:Uncharacterized protein n=1 Tax=Sporothrix schenckii 1099-18 TaxID=1397361 RepID=A0A0F2MDJ1_SPOSC|nr:uncharacterized protein SPSK_02011 [Sporothrix schenckii 1099-18]KJR86925.1 hypothetical protein SPSK_02011 [Sporothrix schenckii 1099-18]
MEILGLRKKEGKEKERNRGGRGDVLYQAATGQGRQEQQEGKSKGQWANGSKEKGRPGTRQVKGRGSLCASATHEEDYALVAGKGEYFALAKGAQRKSVVDRAFPLGWLDTAPGRDSETPPDARTQALKVAQIAASIALDWRR